MPYSIINTDITEIQADIIVNASNGIGFMGGFLGKWIAFSGVAESIHYKTKGFVEKEAKKVCKKNKYLPRYICGHKPGDIFVTTAANLNANYIIHAVTMYFPGTITSMRTIKKLLPTIILKAYELQAKTIAIPLLGTGTGRLSKEEVLDLYEECFSEIKDLEIIICDI